MYVLIVNAGSSSLKTTLFHAKTEKPIVRYHYERLGEVHSVPLTITKNGRSTKKKIPVVDIGHALRHNVQDLLESNSVKNLQQITKVVHRVVHGGEFYHKATPITSEVKNHIRALSLLAPLHNPVNLHGIEIAELHLPHAKNIAVFDTAYHQTLPEHAFRYGIPSEMYRKHKIRKYGFHGTSHKFLALEARRLTKAKKTITCHLGNGSSIAANKNCKSIDTTMGFTPTDGLIMGTRSGALDPEVVLYLLRQMHFSPARLDTFLNKKSGLLGVSHVSADVRDLWKHRSQKKARLALDMLSYHITKKIGAYVGILGGVDTLVFSGGIGENAWYVRRDALLPLKHLGIRLDEKKNKAAMNKKKPVFIHGRGSKVKVLVIPANEELQMLREA